MIAACDFDFIMKQEVGPIIRQRKCKPRALNDIDPTFLLDYNEHTHGDELRKNLTLDPALPQWVRSELLALVKNFDVAFAKKRLSFTFATINAASTLAQQNQLQSRIFSMGHMKARKFLLHVKN
jgi:hypothetical protein